MLRAELVTVGSLPKGAFTEIADEYKKFLLRTCRLEHRVVKSAEGLAARLPNDAFVVALDAAGEHMTSEKFAEHVRHWEDTGRLVVFIVGGAHGLPTELKQEADLLLSLSKMTTTHDLAQLFLLEQLFRALAIVHGSDYHK